MNTHHPIVFIGLVAALVLAACGGAAGTAQSSSPLSASYPDALPVASQLAAGTLKLDGSATAVDAEQASQLLPLWQGLQSLLGSDTSSDQEIQGLVAQIETSMTNEQVAAIAAMQITQADLAELLQNRAAAAADGANSAQIQATRRASSDGGPGQGGGFGPGAGGGEFIGGGPGGGSAGLPGASSGVPQSTASANQQGSGQAYQSQVSAAGVSQAMIRVVIQYLQSKTG